MKTFFGERFSWEPLAPAVLSTARFDLHLVTPPFTIIFFSSSFFYQMLYLYPRASFISLMITCLRELSTFKRTISACELYTILTLCLYSQTSLSHINTALESWGIIFLENKTCVPLQIKYVHLYVLWDFFYFIKCFL